MSGGGRAPRTAEEWLAGRTGTTPKPPGASSTPPGASSGSPPRPPPSSRASCRPIRRPPSPTRRRSIPAPRAGSSPRPAGAACVTSRTAAPAPRPTPTPIQRPPQPGSAPSHQAVLDDAEGVGHLHLSGPAAVIARMDNAISHHADRIFRDARKEGRPEPPEAYAFDAAEQLLTRRGDGADVPAGADAKIIVRVDHGALQRGHAIDGEVCEVAGRGPDRCRHRAGVAPGRVRRCAGHRWRRRQQGRAPGRRFTAAAAHRPPVAGPDLCSAGLQPPRPRVRPLPGLGRHPHHPHRVGQALLPGLPPAQDDRLARLPAGPDGQCDFSEPAHDDDLSRLAESCATAIASRRRQHAPRARSDPDPPALFDRA